MLFFLTILFCCPLRMHPVCVLQCLVFETCAVLILLRVPGKGRVGEGVVRLWDCSYSPTYHSELSGGVEGRSHLFPALSMARRSLRAENTLPSFLFLMQRRLLVWFVPSALSH